MTGMRHPYRAESVSPCCPQTHPQEYWVPHNRPAARRLQNMGFTPNNQIWVSTRGGDVLINKEPGIVDEAYETASLNSRGFGILDVG